MNMIQHGVGASTYVADQFEAQDIGAPFKVILHNAVKVRKNEETGELVSYSIPDLEGLIVAVVISRILHPRKLFGADIKFIRKAICLKQKDLASKLEMSTEHVSRCETGALVMSPSSEKLLRILSLKSAMKLHKMKSCTAKTNIEDALDQLFDAIKPLPVFDVDDVLEFHFYRARPSSDGAGSHDSDDGLWEQNEKHAA
jgi:DNA-binding transcriptional regulator YiaG